MKVIISALSLVIFLLTEGCVEKFTPNVDEVKYVPVVNALITNQPEVYTIRLYWSIPLGEKKIIPLARCDISVHDNLGNIYQFVESSTPGIYNSDETSFRGMVGRKYTLRINTNNATPTHYSYESVPVEMKEVPPIDSLYYEKVLIKEATQQTGAMDGCQIYFDTNDPSGDCRFFRWDCTETWKFEIPYSVPNRVCWISNNSKTINIKNTSSRSVDRIIRYPFLFISNETDRLSQRYSIIVNQYSLNEDEYAYWEKIQDISFNVGSLWDIIPFSIAGNMYCIEKPDEQVLGYFSVSAKTSKRIYIDDTFRGLINLYKECAADTVGLEEPVPGLNGYKWIIYESRGCGCKVITYDHKCADCTVRGTSVRPEFW